MSSLSRAGYSCTPPASCEHGAKLDPHKRESQVIAFTYFLLFHPLNVTEYFCFFASYYKSGPLNTGLFNLQYLSFRSLSVGYYTRSSSLCRILNPFLFPHEIISLHDHKWYGSAYRIPQWLLTAAEKSEPIIFKPACSWHFSPINLPSCFPSPLSFADKCRWSPSINPSACFASLHFIAQTTSKVLLIRIQGELLLSNGFKGSCCSCSLASPQSPLLHHGQLHPRPLSTTPTKTHKPHPKLPPNFRAVQPSCSRDTLKLTWSMSSWGPHQSHGLGWPRGCSLPLPCHQG